MESSEPQILESVLAAFPSHVRTNFTKDFIVPSEDRFSEDRTEFLDAPELRSIAANVIDAFPADFDWLETAGFEIAYKWKDKGGESGGNMTRGKCVKQSGLAKYWSCGTNDGAPIDFVIWAAADHVAACRFTYLQVYALIYHELKHIRQDEKGKPMVVGHEFEGFIGEIEVFGPWKAGLEAMRDAFAHHPARQGSLFDRSEED